MKLFAGFLFAALLAGCELAELIETERRVDDQGREIYSAMSPCQCTLAGGCGITMSIPADGVYADGTSPGDYDPWGGYLGDRKVPLECRPDAQGKPES